MPTPTVTIQHPKQRVREPSAEAGKSPAPQAPKDTGQPAATAGPKLTVTPVAQTTPKPTAPTPAPKATGKPDAATAARSTGQERRRDERLSVSLPGKLLFKGGEATCVVYDISPGGAHISTEKPVPSNLPVRLKVTQRGEFLGLVAWHKGDHLGLRFIQFLEDGMELPEDIEAPPERDRGPRP